MARIQCVSRLTLLVVCVLTIGCETGADCNRARNEVAKTWESVKNLATKRKFAQDDTENPLLRQQRLDRWQPVEDKAALLESSFITPQVTWQSAAKARGDINQHFSRIPESDDRGIPRFASLLDKANQRQSEFEKTCR